MSITSTDPTISVIALCFNHIRFIEECLESIRVQTYKDYELVIMDDHSSDGSVEKIRHWISKNNIKCKFIAHEINIGICKTLNEAISFCTGDFICMIATDDKWRPNRIESHLKILRTNKSKNIGVIYSDTAQINESGKSLPKTFLQMQRPDFKPSSGIIFNDLADRNFVHPLASTIKRNAIIEVGGYDERLATEDYDMWLRLSNKFEFIYSNEIISDYRIVENSITRTLFIKPTAKYAYGLFIMYEKWIPTQLLSQKQKSYWVENQGNAAYWLYFHSDGNAARCLWRVFFRNYKIRFFLLASLSSLGITRSRAKKILSMVNFGSQRSE